MIHERVDTERWKAMFPLARLREEAREFVLRRHAEKPGTYAGDEALQRHIALCLRTDPAVFPSSLSLAERARTDL